MSSTSSDTDDNVNDNFLEDGLGETDGEEDVDDEILEALEDAIAEDATDGEEVRWTFTDFALTNCYSRNRTSTLRTPRAKRTMQSPSSLGLLLAKRYPFPLPLRRWTLLPMDTVRRFCLSAIFN